MNIKKFSILTKISAHTIRYYEKIGLLTQISRNSSGHRCFTQKDINWLEFIKRLKDTGMPLDNILKYSELREKGTATSELRMNMLQQHAVLLAEKISAEQQHLHILQQKIEHYSAVLKLEVKSEAESKVNA